MIVSTASDRLSFFWGASGFGLELASWGEDGSVEVEEEEAESHALLGSNSSGCDPFWGSVGLDILRRLSNFASGLGQAGDFGRERLWG